MNTVSPLLISGFLLLFLLVLCGCTGDAGGAGGIPVAPAEQVLGPLDVDRVTTGDLEVGIHITGTLEPSRRVDVKAQVPGTVSRILVDRGDRLTHGQAMLVLVAEGVRSQATGAESGVQAAKVGLALAERQAESARVLHEAGAMSAIELEQAMVGVEAARAQVASAEAVASGSREQVDQLVLRAPFEGIVSDRWVEVGEAVYPGRPVISVVDVSRLELVAHVSVSEAARLEIGQDVLFRIESFREEAYRGKMVRMEPTADPMTRQVGIYLQLENPGHLVGGLFATGKILTQHLTGVPLVPAEAVHGDGPAAFVWMVEGGRMVRRGIAVAGRDEGRGLIAVSEGVQEGDMVLVAPIRDIEEGMRVAPIELNMRAEGYRHGNRKDQEPE